MSFDDGLETPDDGIPFGRLHLAIRNGVVIDVAKKPAGITDNSPKELSTSIRSPDGPKGALTSLTEVGQVYSLSLIKRATTKSIQSFGRCISVSPRLNVGTCGPPFYSNQCLR